ncbi:MAG TPA: dihydrolipoamide acetyltransferase family protein [Beutenbergiaceae bacterium]|nr:dihydrolipoamide acetyltransferase family protein [Beutenbergiaceae bacterium]
MPQYVKFTLPDVGEGLTEADIVEWKVAPGDMVAVNQEIVEIETAKSLVELPSPHAGVISEILAEVGQTVPVGEPIIVIDTDPDGEGADGSGTDGASRAGEQGAGSPSRRSPQGVDDGDGHSQKVDTAAHQKQAVDGAAHRENQVVDGGAHPGETARQDAAQGEGGSGGVLVGYGTKSTRPRRRRRVAAPTPAAPASTPAAAPSESAAAAQTAPTTPPAHASAPAAAPSSAAPTFAATQSAPATVSPPATVSQHGAVLAKPPVRKLAKDLGIDLTRIRGTGPGGIITREDVLAANAQEEPQVLATHPGDAEPWVAGGTVSADGRQTRVPVRSVRRRTAEAMVASAFTAPHVTVFTTVDVTKTMKLVKRLRQDPEFADVRITPLLIAAKALILAIRRNPTISAAWDDAAQEIVYKHYVNLGIAAATPRGLVVPNIKDAHRMSLRELAEAIGDLTSTARAGKTTPAAMSDGTVTITNVGVFGIDTGTPILNPGESAILAFGAIDQRPWVHKGKLKARWVTQLALSFDHRLVDGELGSRVLADVARVMEDPSQGLVWG